MPPITTTTWTTVLRRAVHSARQSIAQKANTHKLVRARALARQVVQETFPNLTQPTFPRASPALDRARASARTFRPIQFTTPFQRAGMAVRNAPFRLTTSHPRGAALVGQVGLAPARTFASSSTGAASANVHVLLRAFVGLDDRSLPKASKYDSYPRARRQRMRRRPGRLSRVDIARSRSIRDIEHFFPRALRSPPLEPLPPTPESLVTDGIITTLAIALAPSLQELLAPSTGVTYAQAEVGISVFSTLLKGVLPLHELYSLHSSTHVLPLLHKLDSLGVLHTDLGCHTVRLEVIPDPEGRPDILHIVFPNRSTRDIKELLGETLGGESWYALYETVPLTVEEDEAIAEQWDSELSSPSITPPSSFVPSSPYSTATSGLASSYDVSSDEARSLIIPRIDVGAAPTPPSPPSPIVEVDTSSDIWPAEDMAPFEHTDSANWSVYSDHQSEIGSISSVESAAWSVSPSETDTELESLIDEMEWSEQQEQPEAPERPESPEIWISSGYGFMQPW